MMLRIFAVFAVVALTACARTQTAALPPAPDVSMSLVQVVHKPHAVAYTFRVKNDSQGNLDQTLIKSFCMAKTSPNTQLAPTQTIDVTVEVDQTCKLSTFDEEYRIGGIPGVALFTFDFAKISTGFGSNYFGGYGRGYNGLCGETIRDAAKFIVGIRVFEGTSPTPGCYTAKTASAPRAPFPFDLTIENAGPVEMKVTTAPRDCIANPPNGTIATSSSATYHMETTTDPSYCRLTANFASYVTVDYQGSPMTIGYVEWQWWAPNLIRLHPVNDHGYCGVTLDSTHVKFYKQGRDPCPPR